MKRIIFTSLLFIPFVLLAQQTSSWAPEKGEIPFKVLQTTSSEPLHQVRSTPFTPHFYSLHQAIDLDASKVSHKYWGCGVSLTDASCFLLSEMPREKREAFLRDAFTPEGMNLSMIRLNCGASDYSTALYNYNDVAGDVQMKHFSIDRDLRYMIPVIKEAMGVRPDMYVYSAIWSEPGWMKTSGQMCGGALKDEFVPAFASYLAAYLKAYADAGVHIDAMSVHNEPLTDQAGGCPASLISTEQEKLLAGKLLPKAFRKAGVDTKIWLHDYDYTYVDRVLEELSDKDVLKNIDAVAWHPYGKGTPDLQKKVREKYPDLTMHLTERGPNLGKRDIQDVNWWADVVFGALNNGSSSYSSWNLLLDTDGQPCTGKYNCGGLEEIDTKTGEIRQSTQALLFRQFCPYVQHGADILSIEQPADDIRAIAFRNPDGSHVVVVVAQGKPDRQKVQIKFKDQYLCLSLPLYTWSMTTVIIEGK